MEKNINIRVSIFTVYSNEIVLIVFDQVTVDTKGTYS